MQSSYGRPQYAPAPPAVSLTKARPWLIGLAASATMLVIIAAIGNPPVTRAIYRHSAGGFGADVVRSFVIFFWDFGRLGNDPQHIYRANLVFDLVTLVLVLLLVAVLASGRGSFWRTFVATWVAVIVAVVLAGYARAALIDPLGTVPDGGGVAQTTFFSQYSPGAVQLFAAIVVGLVVALVAALIAIITRRREVVTSPAPAQGADVEPAPIPASTPDRREAWSAPPAAVPGPVANPSPWSKGEAADSTEDDAERTTAMPVVDGQRRDTGESTGAYTAEGEHTQALPRTEDEPPPRSQPS